MNHPGTTGALAKLIAIRREALEVLRADLFRLDQLKAAASRSRDAAQASLACFLEETRHAERNSVALFVDQMKDRRHFLAHLQEQLDAAGRSLDEVSLQQGQAQDAFDTQIREIRALERLAERRMAVVKEELQRRDYLRADDEELIRNERFGGIHDFH